MKVKLYESEYNFCEILWSQGPKSRKELMKICRAGLRWKGSVTRTAIRRLVKRGAVKVEDGVVSPLISKAEAEVTTKWCLFDLLHGGSVAPGVIRGDKMAITQAGGMNALTDRSMVNSPGVGGGQQGNVIWPH